MKNNNPILVLLILFSTISCSDNEEPVMEIEDKCQTIEEVYAFEYDSKMYEIMKIKKTWNGAADCAKSRGGYLAEINDMQENRHIVNVLLGAAGIDPANSTASDGDSASYVWIGGTDVNDEGKWFWDGRNEGDGVQFWEGAFNGVAIDNSFTNWGNEPDDFNNQDGLAIAFTDWMRGSVGEWNDISTANNLYFVIEYD